MHRGLVEDIKTFEKMRLRLRDKPDHLVLEGKCHECKLITCTPIHLYEYMQAMAYVEDADNVLTTCPRCNSNSLAVPHFI